MKKSIALLLIITLLWIPVYATSHVICKVEVLSEDSATITLTWSDKTQTTPIQIVGWNKLDDTTLKVIYVKGNHVHLGWNKRTIQGQGYAFPMKIVLEEQESIQQVFTDLPNSHEEKYSILNLYYRGIINGYPDGKFKPEANVTRAEFAKMLTSTAGFSINQTIPSKFSDVKESFWGKDYIMTLARKSIFNGRPNGEFDPHASISVGEVLAVINRTFLIHNKEADYPHTLATHWSNNDFLFMVEKGIVKDNDSYYNPYVADKKITRTECAILLSRVLEKLHETK